MKTAVLRGVRDLVIEDRPIPEIGDDDVLIRNEYVGICGSDLHFYNEGGIGVAKIYEPRVLGHESVGRVAAMGKNVTGLKEGDNVILDPGISCGHCEYCRTGHYNLCPVTVKKFLGNPWTDGVFQEYISYPQHYVQKLSDDFPKLRAVMIEPYVVALHAVSQSKAHYGQNAVVLGSGCIGIMTMIALKQHGIHQIFMVDVIDNRLAMAQQFADVKTFNPQRENPVERVMELTNNEGVDLVFETAGSLITQGQTVEYVRKCGMITFVGFSNGESVPYDISTLMRREATITTVFRYANQFRKAIHGLTQNPVPLENMISQIYPLEDIKKAFDENLQDKERVIKAVIQI